MMFHQNLDGMDMLNSLLKRSHRNTDYLQDLLKEKNLAFLIKNAEEQEDDNKQRSSKTEEENKKEEEDSTVSPSSFIPRSRRMSIGSVTLEQVILQQSAEGYWRLTAEFAQLLQQKITLEDLQESIPEALTNKTRSWATVLALAFLELKFKHKSDRWELIAKKANTWLDNELKGTKLIKSELIEDAATFLEDASV
jgi:hypothetical protein